MTGREENTIALSVRHRSQVWFGLFCEECKWLEAKRSKRFAYQRSPIAKGPIPCYLVSKRRKESVGASVDKTIFCHRIDFSLMQSPSMLQNPRSIKSVGEVCP